MDISNILEIREPWQEQVMVHLHIAPINLSISDATLIYYNITSPVDTNKH